jgi:hypothetical protein
VTLFVGFGQMGQTGATEQDQFDNAKKDRLNYFMSLFT